MKISTVRIDKGLGIGKHLVATHVKAKGVANNTLTYSIGFGQAIDQVKGISNIAVQGRIASAYQFAERADRLCLIGGSTILLTGLCQNVFLMLQRFLKTVAAKIIKNFEWQPKRIHLPMTLYTLRLSGDYLDSFTKCFVWVFRNLSINGDWYIRNTSSEQFFPNPTATFDWIGMKIG